MSDRDWYYEHGGVESGPVLFSSLKDLAAAGQVLPDDAVWSRDSIERVRAADVPGLFNGATVGDTTLPPMAQERVVRPDQTPLPPQ